MKEKINMNTKSHQFVIEKLKEAGIETYKGGIQLFTDQYSDDYSVSVNYKGTGVRISKTDIAEYELVEDELIEVCWTWEWRGE